MAEKRQESINRSDTRSMQQDPLESDQIQMHKNVKHRIPRFLCFIGIRVVCKNPPVHALRIVSSANDDAIQNIKNNLTAQQFDMFRQTFCVMVMINEEDFMADVTSNNRLLVDYFYGGENVKKEHLITCFDDKRWGSNDEDAVKISILYFIHNFIFSQ
ncbi:hypothetical protein H5410_023638 [Solanum commersonii]|uniref:Uncharacterized protein n=1 Tax=Solanum commersonii TaxID=4109 RepID=A0A9J5ZIL5_SOLCO|nr:hypothetical protein H5410_023638 [Solanum commersonii]